MELLCLKYTKLDNSKTITSNFDFDMSWFLAKMLFKQFIVEKISFHLKNRILYYPLDTLKVVQKILKPLKYWFLEYLKISKIKVWIIC